LGSNGTITATAGTNLLYTNGTGNTITGGSGTDKIQAFSGGNTLKAGSGTETISFAGSNNTIYAGSGSDTLNDSGSANKIVFGKAGGGTAQIFGYVLQNGDTLDFRTTLANTSWNKDSATLGDYLKIGASGNDAVISIDPSGATGGPTYQLAVLHSSGPVSMAGLLAHSIAA
jgi:Ca2+-binding RTX toxin-like protein